MRRQLHAGLQDDSPQRDHAWLPFFLARSIASANEPQSGACYLLMRLPLGAHWLGSRETISKAAFAATAHYRASAQAQRDDCATAPLAARPSPIRKRCTRAIVYYFTTSATSRLGSRRRMRCRFFCFCSNRNRIFLWTACEICLVTVLTVML